MSNNRMNASEPRPPFSTHPEGWRRYLSTKTPMGRFNLLILTAAASGGLFYYYMTGKAEKLKHPVQEYVKEPIKESIKESIKDTVKDTIHKKL